MDGMEKLIYVHASKLGDSFLKKPRARESGFKDSTNVWYVIKRGSNDSVEISPVFEDIKSLNYPDPALEETECQVIGSCIYVIGGMSVYTRISPKRYIDPGSSKIRCLDTRNPKEGWRTRFSLPLPVYSVRSAIVDDQWLYFLGGNLSKGSYPWGYAVNVDDFSKEKVVEISQPVSPASLCPVVSSLSPGTFVAYIEQDGIAHQLDCTNNSWTGHLKDLPSSWPADIYMGTSTISDGILYIIDSWNMHFISYDIRNKKELPQIVLPRSSVWPYQCFVNLVVLAKNKFCILWNSLADDVNCMTINYVRFSVSYDLPNPTAVVEETQQFKNIGGITILNVVTM